MNFTAACSRNRDRPNLGMPARSVAVRQFGAALQVMVHVPQQHEKGPILIDETIRLGDSHPFEVLGLVELPLLPFVQGSLADVRVESPGALVAAETYASGDVA